ncbi:uncharacterized protein Tco025E_05786 [Trypanosoma conorhini]|uniref:Uncharacterized protein n=1 Tax=Trypanosoma conorhini TaxID=83891 RepID=A0A422PAG1_9TRYP|nr:uncharacterized protein Tco025E_05786 [Trypanosoma conorhini]RNF14705.1 hypothetical protein Tco025E_05786 [Trypanosoma conorhini]
MTIRCLTRRRAQWTPTALTVSVRLVRRKLSPDRTRDEEIQDRQNAFVWHEKHIFRPHQHFTYDPSSWSRPLEEKMKAKRKLSLVERLRALEEREAEAAHAIEEAKGPEELQECAEDVDYFYSIQEPKGNAISLQAQVERLNALHVLLTAPRHLDTSLVKVERLRHEYRELLRLVFERVRVAVVGETMTFDALLYSWFLLLQGAQPLLEALTEGEGHAGSRLHDVIVTVRDALDTLLLHAMKRIDAEGKLDLVLEGWVELLDVVTHPFTRQGEKLRGSQRASCHAFNVGGEGLEKKVADRAMTALAERMITDDGSELLDAQHLHALLRSMVRCSCVMEDASLQRAALLTRKVLEGILATLKGVVAPSLPHSMQLSLLGSSARRVAFNAGESTRGRDAPRQAVLDPCDPPGGIKSPVTAADEVSHAMCAGIALLRQAPRASQVTQAKVLDAVDLLLLMLSYAPNYDLGLTETATFVCEMVAGGVLDVDTGTVERHLRAVLLLSRLKFSTCNNQTVLSRLFLFLCSLAPPESCPELTLREWKRLYGTVMHQLLSSVRAAALSEHYARGHNSPATWEELLAFGRYRGALPLSLWHEACQRYFESPAVPLSSKCARALLSLRARCTPSASVGFAQKANPASLCAAPLDFDSVRLLARLLHVVLGECVAAEDLMNEAAAWGAAQDAAGDDEALSALLLAAQRCVQERQACKHAVMTFS